MPRTIHDFQGFPRELFEVEYPAPGNPKIAEEIQRIVTHPKIQLDNEQWGLDHGTWAVEFDEWVKERLRQRDDVSLVQNFQSRASGKWSVPTPDHYYPWSDLKT